MRGIYMDAKCSLYDMIPEIVEYLLRDCDWFSKLWLLNPLALNVNGFPSINFTSWLFNDILPKGVEVMERTIIMACAIWNAKNCLIFDHKQLDPLATVRIGSNCLLDF